MMFIAGEKVMLCSSERAFTPERCSNFVKIIFSFFVLKLLDGDTIFGIFFFEVNNPLNHSLHYHQ